MSEEVKVSLSTERAPIEMNPVAYGVSSEDKQAQVEISINHEVSIEEMQYETGDSRQKEIPDRSPGLCLYND